MDRSSGRIGGGITPFSKQPYVTLSRHTAPSRGPTDTPKAGSKSLHPRTNNPISSRPPSSFYSCSRILFSRLDSICNMPTGNKKPLRYQLKAIERERTNNNNSRGGGGGREDIVGWEGTLVGWGEPFSPPPNPTHGAAAGWGF